MYFRLIVHIHLNRRITGVLSGKGYFHSMDFSIAVHIEIPKIMISVGLGKPMTKYLKLKYAELISITLISFWNCLWGLTSVSKVLVEINFLEHSIQIYCPCRYLTNVAKMILTVSAI